MTCPGVLKASHNINGAQNINLALVLKTAGIKVAPARVTTININFHTVPHITPHTQLHTTPLDI